MGALPSTQNLHKTYRGPHNLPCNHISIANTIASGFQYEPAKIQNAVIMYEGKRASLEILRARIQRYGH